MNNFKNTLYIKILYFVIFILFATGIVLFIIQEKDSRIETLTQKNKTSHQNEISSTILQFKNATKLIFNSMINKEDILRLQKLALTAKDETTKSKYRQILYEKLTPLYSDLKKFGIKQLHFHLPDTTSFLRFHKPSKFGDNLKNIRYSLVLANKDKKEVSGFEEGRIFNGYRFVFPLNYKEEHIGTVEISIGINAIKNISKNVYQTYQYMILHQDIIKGKVFSAERKNYDKSELNEHFYHEAKTFENDKKNDKTDKDLVDIEIFNQINNILKKQITTQVLLKYSHIVKYVKINKKTYYISFLPIQNILKHNIGYLISYKRCECYSGLINEYYTKGYLLFGISLALLLFFYKMTTLKNIANEQRDQALNANKSKSEFLANMSHEIRTPLNAILGFIEFLKEESRGGKSEQYVNIIEKSSFSLLKIIEDILDFSKIESGKLNIDKIDFNTKAEFEVITHLFNAKCSQKNITMTLNIDKNIPQNINTDPLRVKQIISNLLSNAIKFSNSGTNIFIDIAYKKNVLKVNIKDEGIGIAKEKLKHIFEAFNQEDNSTTRKYGGTGLGLSISSELVKLLGGELKVKSKVEEGSEFYFTIPVTEGKKLNLNKDYKIDLNFKNKKILLVEDNKANTLFMKVILDKINLDYDLASDGLEAINSFRINKYDAILMDENMPNMNGIEATKNILLYEQENKRIHTPIIALTANALKGDRERFIKAGMDEYLTKPLNQEKLINTLNKFLKQEDTRVI